MDDAGLDEVDVRASPGRDRCDDVVGPQGGDQVLADETRGAGDENAVGHRFGCGAAIRQPSLPALRPGSWLT